MAGTLAQTIELLLEDLEEANQGEKSEYPFHGLEDDPDLQVRFNEITERLLSTEGRSDAQRVPIGVWARYLGIIGSHRMVVTIKMLNTIVPRFSDALLHYTRQSNGNRLIDQTRNRLMLMGRNNTTRRLLAPARCKILAQIGQAQAEGSPL